MGGGCPGGAGLRREAKDNIAVRPSGDVSKGAAKIMQEKEEEKGYLMMGSQTPRLRRRVVVIRTQTRLQSGLEGGKATQRK